MQNTGLKVWKPETTVLHIKTDSAQSSSNKCKKLITKNLRIAQQLFEYYLKQLTLVHFSRWPRD